MKKIIAGKRITWTFEPDKEVVDALTSFLKISPHGERSRLINEALLVHAPELITAKAKAMAEIACEYIKASSRRERNDSIGGRVEAAPVA